MGQYNVYSEGQYKYVVDPLSKIRYRSGQRNGKFVEDVELIIGGFAGVENTGWKNLTQSTEQSNGLNFREGTREIYEAAEYVLDVELTETGFSGQENIDWKLIRKAPYDDANILIILWGDSNEGGAAPNSSATATELSERARVQIWDNINNDGFEALHIGVNNLLGHTGLEGYVTHGCELELANQTYLDLFRIPTIYLCKTGQGGSATMEWVQQGSQSLAKFDTRVNGAIATIGNSKPLKIYMIGSQGLNNAIGSLTSPTVYYNDMVTIINHFRGIIGNDAPIYLFKLHSNDVGTDVTEYNAKIVDLANNLQNIFIINTDDVVLSDAYHFTYLDYKEMMGRVLPVIANNFKYGSPVISI